MLASSTNREFQSLLSLSQITVASRYSLLEMGNEICMYVYSEVSNTLMVPCYETRISNLSLPMRLDELRRVIRV